uniref:PCI domain-containing protein n=1 Tax=Salix viminalis TaxID=40686 RepID=A0A6N2NBC2_SALVM
MSTSHLPATTDSIAQALEAKNPSEAISIYYLILENQSASPESLRIKEQAITNLSDLLRQENRGEDLRSLLTQLRPFFALIPKAKTAKIVRGIIDTVAKIPGTSDLQISLCKEMVQWTRAEKRTFLRQRVEARLAALLMENKEYSEALNLLSGLIKEVRRLDDKLLLVDIDLLESKLHFSLRNLPKAKAALTAARTAANAIYVPPAQQGTIDLQSGILHAEEKDYKTAYSYFFEAFEAFNALEDPRAVFSLKYMLLCKIMVSQADDVAGIISSKAGLQYVGPELDAMKAVADAHAKRSLKLFETALRDFKAQLEEDPIVHRHLSSLYDTLLEQNLCRLIEPFSRVEIAHIADLIELPIDHVEKKLSQMILDKKFAGTLDQGAGCLVIFEDPKTDAIYPATLETISNIGKVVDSLYVRSLLLSQSERFVCKIMSEVYEGYERQYCELSANLSRKCNSTSLLPDGVEKNAKVNEIKSGLDDCDVLIRKMDLEARSLQPNVKAMLLAKLREYKSDLNKLKREFKRITSGDINQASRVELLEAGMADVHSVSADQRERMTMSVERLNQSGDRIKESRRTMLETEELGVSVLEDLHQQRQTLLHAHNKLHGVDDAIDKSKKVLTSMLRRMTRNKWIVGSVIAALVVAIIFIILFKISHH